MHRHCHTRSLSCPVLAALGLALAPLAVHADVPRTGAEPWYQQADPDARQRAKVLFARAVEKHQQLLRSDAKELYEQALRLWDNPDIRWNLALVLEDLGEYLLAHQHLSSMLRWETALGAQRLRDVRNRMQALETHLGKVEAHGEEVGAEIKLDGQPWSLVAGSRDTLVNPGEHYVSASKPGFFPVTVPVLVTMGLQAHVTLQMDADHLVGTPRWSSWKPWAVVASGVAATAIGAGLEWRAFANRNTAAHDVASSCGGLACSSVHTPDIYNRAMTEHRAAVGAFAVGGVAVTIGLMLAWLNHPLWHRSEPRAHSTPTFTPLLSPDRTGASALIRF